MEDSLINIFSYSLVIVFFAIIFAPLFLAIRLFIGKLGNLFPDDPDAKYWHWGYYNNKNDKRVFVPLRVSWGRLGRIGRTLNYGHPFAKILLLLRTIPLTFFVGAIFICLKYGGQFRFILLFVIAIMVNAINFLVNRLSQVIYRNSLHNDEDSIKHWRWGYYYNKDNKQLFVPSVLDSGWTLNYGHRYAKIILLLLALLLLFIALRIGSRHFH